MFGWQQRMTHNPQKVERIDTAFRSVLYITLCSAGIDFDADILFLLGVERGISVTYFQVSILFTRHFFNIFDIGWAVITSMLFQSEVNA